MRASVVFLKFAEINATSLRSRRQHKAWGEAQRNPRFESAKNNQPAERALERGFRIDDLSNTRHESQHCAAIVRGYFGIDLLTYAGSVARCRGLMIICYSNLGFRCASPQALCCCLL